MIYDDVRSAPYSIHLKFSFFLYIQFKPVPDLGLYSACVCVCSSL